MFNTVKIQGKGFLINGSIYTEPIDGTPYYEGVKMYIAKGGIVEPEFTNAELAKQAQELINAKARTYLASTDWYVIREQETGVPIPQDVSDARAQARLDIVPAV